MSDVQIRIAASDSDLIRVRSLLVEYANLRGHDAALGNFQGELEQLPGAYAPPKGCLLMAVWQDQPAGLVAFRELNARHCEMKRLFVLPEFQGLGIGSALVRTILVSATEAGYKRIYLDTHPWMNTAERLYVQLGFRRVAPYNWNPTPGIKHFAMDLPPAPSSR